MKAKKIILCAVCASIATISFSGCDDDDVYSIGAPADLQDRIEAAAAAKSNIPEEEELEGMMEDVYEIGASDYSTGWWQAFSKYYVIPRDETWNSVFKLNLNPSESTLYYQNFALIITNDVDRGGEGYTEYGAFRYDFTNDTTAYNSIWGSHIFFQYSDCDVVLAPESNIDKNVQKLGGKVTLTVTNGDKNFAIKIANGSVTKTYNVAYGLPSLNAEATNKNIRCFLVPEGSYLSFLQTNIEPIGGCTSANDKQPIKLTISNVPNCLEYSDDISLEEITKDVIGVVEFEEGVTLNVTAEDLIFMAIPNLSEVGKKTLIAAYSKTFKGEGTTNTVMDSKEFEITSPIEDIEVSASTIYYFADSTKLLLNNYAGILTVKAIHKNGSKSILSSDKFTVTIADPSLNIQSEVKLNVSYTTATGDIITKEVTTNTAAFTQKSYTSDPVGAKDFTNTWWSTFSQDWIIASGEAATWKMTVSSDNLENWHSPCYIFRKASLSEYAVTRTDSYGWGDSYGGCIAESDWDWNTFKSNIDGSEYVITVTNNGDNTADLYVKVTDGNGEAHFQNYRNVAIDSNDFQFAFVVEESYLEFHK